MKEQRQIPRYQAVASFTLSPVISRERGGVYLSENGRAIESGVSVPNAGYVSLPCPPRRDPAGHRRSGTASVGDQYWVWCKFRILSSSAKRRVQRYLLTDRAA